MVSLTSTYKILCKKCEERRLDLDIDGIIILKWILTLEQDSLLDSAGLEQGPMTRSCKCSDEFSYFMQDTKFLDQLGDCVPWSWE
jgi:hypothetical protein